MDLGAVRLQVLGGGIESVGDNKLAIVSIVVPVGGYLLGSLM